ncbi:MAG TPA: 5-(carboxyamino)imidazole ribonucleotide mutase [Nannocystaceae bacterium]|nr:5-(carboxyamino)imidazole ribonucleotide mutase [Nannocystaceae bacterium]
MSIIQPNARVAILMGSANDWNIVEHCAKTLEELGVAYEARVMSAHRTPDEVIAYAAAAESRGVQVMIAAAGGAAHLAGVVSAKSLLPVIGIPIEGWALNGLDSLLSTVQMPGGVPVATVAIGKAGAVNAALLAVAIISRSDADLRKRWGDWRAARSEAVRNTQLPPR